MSTLPIVVLTVWSLAAILALLFNRGAAAFEKQQQWLDSVQIQRPASN
ncbi:hypothetical protein [Caballeronia sp. GAFFF2]|nr:hypothetical protein [Caballeronia sp. GAFFF2]